MKKFINLALEERMLSGAHRENNENVGHYGNHGSVLDDKNATQIMIESIEAASESAEEKLTGKAREFFNAAQQLEPLV